MLVSNFSILHILFYMLSVLLNIREIFIKCHRKTPEVGHFNPGHNNDNGNVLSVTEFDGWSTFEQYNGQGGLIPLCQSEPLKDFMFEYTYEDFKKDFLMDEGLFIWNDKYVQDIDSINDDKYLASITTKIDFKEDFDFLLPKKVDLFSTNKTFKYNLDKMNIRSYNFWNFIDNQVFKLLGTYRTSITSSYKKICNQKDNKQCNGNLDIDQNILTVKKESGVIDKDFSKHFNKFKIVINSMINLFKYVKNLFCLTKFDKISIREKRKFKKINKLEKLNSQKSIRDKINEIEKKIFLIERKLDYLIESLKLTSKIENNITLSSSLFLLVIPISILFGLKEFKHHEEKKRL